MSENQKLRGTLNGRNTLSGRLNAPSVLNGKLGLRPYMTGDYELLSNKPLINGVELIGNRDAYDLQLVYSDTTEGWNAIRWFIPAAGSIIIYTDYETEDGIDIPNYKIGDGQAYLIDLPFVDDGIRDLLRSHVSDVLIHVSQEDRNRWNNKVRCFVTPDGDDYGIVFTTD